MYLSCQAKEGETDVFFEHENYAWPPSQADNNKMRHENKVDLLKCLETPCTTSTIFTWSRYQNIWWCAFLHKLEPNGTGTVVKSCQDCYDNVFIPYLFKQLQTVKRVDVVWNSYTTESLKYHTRECCGMELVFEYLEKHTFLETGKLFCIVTPTKLSYSSF